MEVAILKLIEAVGTLGSLAATRRDQRRNDWDRMADHLDSIAAALDRAASTIDDGEIPFRDYAALQRYAATFEDVAYEAFGGLTGDDDFREFLTKLHDAVGEVAAVDTFLLGFTELPVPDWNWDGKSSLLQDAPADRPPLDDSERRLLDVSTAKLVETAAVMRAQAGVVRARRA